MRYKRDFTGNSLPKTWHLFVLDEGPEETILASLGLLEHRTAFVSEVETWCDEQFEPHEWHIYGDNAILVYNPEDAVAFRCRWG